MKHILYIFIIILLFIVQTTFVNIVSIVGIKPNLLLIFVVLIGFLKRENDGLFVGCITGFLHDSYFSSYIGSNLFVYGVIGYLTGIICKEFVKGNVITPMVIVSASTIVYGVITFAINILLQGFTNIGYYLFIIVIPEVVYNCIFTIPIYILMYYINGKLEYKVKTKRNLF